MHALAGVFLVLAFSPFVWMQQIPLTPPGAAGIDCVHQVTQRIVTPELNAFVQEIVDRNKIPGLSLGVVHGTDYISETGTWGRRTEDGAEVTPDVSTMLLPLIEPDQISSLTPSLYILDFVFLSLMFKGLSVGLSRHLDG